MSRPTTGARTAGSRCGGIDGAPRPWRQVALGCELAVLVRPGAREDRLGPVVVDAAGAARLEVRVRAATQEGRANEAVRRVLAAALGIAPGRVTLVAGGTARRKRLALTAVAPQQLDALAAGRVATSR